MSDRLSELTPIIRAKVAAVLKDLHGHGYKDAYVASGLRNKAEQAQKVKDGVSQTQKSRHLGGKDGLARAADIVPKSQGWNAGNRFWFMLASSARAHGLGVGILFGLNSERKAKLWNAISRLSALGWPEHHELYEVARGWDPAHVQDIVNWS